MNIPKHESFRADNPNNSNHFLQNNRIKKPAGVSLVTLKLTFYHKTSLPAAIINARKGIVFTFQN